MIYYVIEWIIYKLLIYYIIFILMLFTYWGCAGTTFTTEVVAGSSRIAPSKNFINLLLLFLLL